MSKTFYEILQDVCTIGHIKQPASFSSTKRPYPEIKQYIKDTLDDICSNYEWTFREKTYTFSTVANQRIYDFPAGFEGKFLLQDGVRMANYIPALYYVPVNILDQIVITTARPRRHSMFNNQLILDPTPNDVYSMSLRYLTSYYAKNPTTVDASSASGQKTLNVTSTTGFSVGDTVYIADNTAYSETGVISTITAGVSLNLVDNLTYTHSAGASVYAQRANFSLTDDTCIIPDRWIKTLVWGAYYLYRQNFKVDDKFVQAQKQYAKYLDSMRGEDSYGRDSSPVFVLGNVRVSNTASVVDAFANTGRWN